MHYFCSAIENAGVVGAALVARSQRPPGPGGSAKLTRSASQTQEAHCEIDKATSGYSSFSLLPNGPLSKKAGTGKVKMYICVRMCVFMCVPISVFRFRKVPSIEISSSLCDRLRECAKYRYSLWIV